MPEVKDANALDCEAADTMAARHAEKHEREMAARKEMATDVAAAIKSGALDDKRFGSAQYIRDD